VRSPRRHDGTGGLVKAKSSAAVVAAAAAARSCCFAMTSSSRWGLSARHAIAKCHSEKLRHILMNQKNVLRRKC